MDLCSGPIAFLRFVLHINLIGIFHCNSYNGLDHFISNIDIVINTVKHWYFMDALINAEIEATIIQ